MEAVTLNKTEQALVDSLLIGTEKEVIENPYSGQSIECEPEAVALHDFIKGCEALRLHDKFSLALGIFMKKYPEEYMVLLD
jgi:hypothetical protein